MSHFSSYLHFWFLSLVGKQKEKKRQTFKIVATSKGWWLIDLTFKNQELKLSYHNMRNIVSNSLQPHGLIQSMEFSRPEYWSGWPFPSPGDRPNPGIKPRSHTLQANSLLAELQRKCKNTGVSSLSLLQRILLTQESNHGLLHCREIAYQLGYQTCHKIKTSD